MSAQSLINNPKLLILDEPTNGLDPLMQKKLFNILIEEKEKWNTVFLSSHNLVEVQNLCDRVCVIKEGKIVDIIEIEKSKTELKLKVTLSSSDITDDIVLNLSDKILDKNGKIIYFYIFKKYRLSCKRACELQDRWITNRKRKSWRCIFKLLWK